jgi:transposase
VLEQIASLSQQIKQVNRTIQVLADDHYPQTKLLRQVNGIGPITSLAFVLTLGEVRRFAKSRTVGAFLGLVPGRRQSGHCDPQRRITKQGDSGLRRLLVNAAHYVLGPFGTDCDLRRFGLKISARGGKIAKKKAIVAVARKLAVLLHHLWLTGETYQPLRRQASNAVAA